MKVIEMMGKTLTKVEISTLKTAFKVVDREGLDILGFALIGQRTVVLIDTTKDTTAEEMKESALAQMNENLDGMPDFSTWVNADAEVAAVTMNDGMIMSFANYRDCREGNKVPIGKALEARAAILDACKKGKVKAVAWWDSNPNVASEAACEIR